MPPAQPSMPGHEELHALAPEQSVAAAEAKLRELGERATGPRRRVLEVLAEHPEHVTAKRVAGLLSPRVHRATVYRTLEMLADSGVVSHRQLPGGATTYHLAAAPTGHAHLHAHCLRCAAVIVLPVDSLDAAADRLIALTGFALDPQKSTLIGICSACSRLPAGT
ncbi:MAG: Fur family transcriptional regulator [Candidatus Nanopelagicales bacterium]